MSSSSQDSGWILTDVQQFVVNLFITQRSDEPLKEQLRRIYTEIWSKLSLYSRCEYGLQFFVNTIHSAEHGVKRFEMEYMFMDSSVSEFSRNSLFARHHSSEESASLHNAPDYFSIDETDPLRANGLESGLRKLLGDARPARISVTKSSNWREIIRWISEKQKERGNTGSPLEACLEFERTKHSILVVPLSGQTTLLPTGTLGVFLLWSKADSVEWDETTRAERLRPVAKLLSATLYKYLQVHYQVTNDTYLPQFRTRGQKKVAVLFSDIRNFTPTTEVMRNFGKISELQKFVGNYCRRFGEVVRKNGGRVQSYSGDGVMALFGEYMADESDATGAAIKCAKEMIAVFGVILQEFIDTPSIQRFYRDEYEPFNIGIGIGINFGPVIFDYVGCDGSRVYTPLGDHVNFAQRLETQAGRFDPHLQRVRSSILVSRPVWRAIGAPKNWTEISIEVKGKPFSYSAYEVPDGKIAGNSTTK